MKVAVAQSNFFPWLGFFHFVNSSDLLIIADNLQFTKSDWRNRNLIELNHQLHRLTLPVQRNNGLKTRISDVVVSQTFDWESDFLRKLHHAYSKYDLYFQLESVLNDLVPKIREMNSLSEINLHTLNYMNELLGIETSIQLQEREYEEVEKNQRLLSICKMYNADRYLSGPKARDYLNIDLFESQGIRVEFCDYSKVNDFLMNFEYIQSPPKSILDTLARVKIELLKEFLYDNQKSC